MAQSLKLTIIRPKEQQQLDSSNEEEAPVPTKITLLGKRQRRDVKWVKRWVHQPNIFDCEKPIWTQKWIAED